MKKEAFEAVRRRFTKKKENDSKEAIKRKEAETMKKKELEASNKKKEAMSQQKVVRRP